MIRQLALFSLFASALALPAGAAEVTEFTLDNGMDVVVLEDHRSPAAVHMVWYRVGSADEVSGKSGIAHLLEHLMFKGTDTVSPGEFSQMVEANGGSDNAFTAWDYTAYFQRASVDLLPTLMELEADRMTNLQLTEELVRPELSVVLEERAQRTDSNPGGLYREQARAAQFLNHPYGRPIIGWRHEIEQLSMDDALDFYREHYVPNNAILIVAGDVDPDDVRSMAEATYGKVAANPEFVPRERVVEPPQLAARRLVFEDPRIAQPYMTRSYLAPERNSGDQQEAAALMLLSDLLGDEPATSFLGKRLQFESNVAVYTSAYYMGTALDRTTFNITIAPSDGVSLAEAEEALDEALAAFFEAGIDETLLTRLKRQYAAADIYAQDDVQGLARRYGTALTSGLTVQDVQEWPAVIQSVTPEQILAAAEAVLVPENSVTGWLQAPAATTAEVTQ